MTVASSPKDTGKDTRQDTPKKRVGVIGSFVWDVLHGRDKRSVPVEEWGGITYSLSALDAALPDDWEIVPLARVGDDLVERARLFCRSLRHMAPDAELIGVPYPNNRVELRYLDDERRTEHLTGGVPAWTWMGLKPVLDAARLDALYINFLSGWELDLGRVARWASRGAAAAACGGVVRVLRCASGERR